MNEPFFLTLDDVLQFHADQIELAGGDAAILDIGKIESAIAQPRMTWQGKHLHEDWQRWRRHTCFTSFKTVGLRTGTIERV